MFDDFDDAVMPCPRRQTFLLCPMPCSVTLACRDLALVGHAQATPAINSQISISINKWQADCVVMALRQYKTVLMAGRLEVRDVALNVGCQAFHHIAFFLYLSYSKTIMLGGNA